MSKESLLANVVVDGNGCWLWQKSLNSNGYGQVWRNGKVNVVHRVSYEIFKGVIPVGLQIDHLCRVRACCNPEHLEAVTQQINLERGNGISALNSRKDHCPKGHDYDTIYRGSRQCSKCKAARNARWQEYRKA